MISADLEPHAFAAHARAYCARVTSIFLKSPCIQTEKRRPQTRTPLSRGLARLNVPASLALGLPATGTSLQIPPSVTPASLRPLHGPQAVAALYLECLGKRQQLPSSQAFNGNVLLIACLFLHTCVGHVFCRLKCVFWGRFRHTWPASITYKTRAPARKVCVSRQAWMARSRLQLQLCYVHVCCKSRPCSHKPMNIAESVSTWVGQIQPWVDKL